MLWCKGTGHFASKCKVNLEEQAKKEKGNSKKPAATQGKAYWVFLSSPTKDDEEWYVDSCASNHITTKNEACRTKDVFRQKRNHSK